MALKDLWHERAGEDFPIAFEVKGNLETIDVLDPSCPLQVMSYQILLIWLRKILPAGLANLGLVRVSVDLSAPVVSWRQAPAIDINIQFCCQDSMACQRLMDESELRSIARMLTCLVLI